APRVSAPHRGSASRQRPRPAPAPTKAREPRPAALPERRRSLSHADHEGISSAKPDSFDGVALAFQAGRARLGKGRLLLLGSTGLLLLRPCILSAALAAGGRRADGRTGARVAHDAADDGPIARAPPPTARE